MYPALQSLSLEGGDAIALSPLQGARHLKSLTLKDCSGVSASLITIVPSLPLTNLTLASTDADDALGAL